MDRRISPVIMARKLAEKYNISTVPVDIEALCNLLGIKIEYVDFSEIENETGKQISGAIYRRGNSKYVILVNDECAEPRARFTIAHELGHYFLHTDSNVRIIVSFYKAQSPTEIEANKFASELLMPKDLLMKEYNKLVIPISDTLAKKFNVSKQTMRSRLDRLELLYI